MIITLIILQIYIQVFDNTSMFRIIAYMLIPGAIFYFLVIDENKMRDEQTGRKANYVSLNLLLIHLL